MSHDKTIPSQYKVTYPMQHYNDFLSEVLIDEETLQNRIRELGAEISADYPDGNLLLICILRGGVPWYTSAATSTPRT
jgi:hypoxanthine-guanine phosphoribosyltransferase